MIGKAEYNALKDALTRARAQTGYNTLSEGEKTAVLNYVFSRIDVPEDDGTGDIE